MTFPARPRRQGPLLLKQAHAVVDERTTMVCLDVAGQIQPVDAPFETLAGEYMTPPFHIHCRTAMIPWLPGFVSEERRKANEEIRKRPAKEKRKGPGGFEGPVPPPPPARAETVTPAPDGPPGPGEVEALQLQLRTGTVFGERGLAAQRKKRLSLARRIARVLLLMNPTREMLALIREALASGRWVTFDDLPEWLRRRILAAERRV